MFATIQHASAAKPFNWYMKAFKINPNAKWRFSIDGLPKDSHKYRINQDGEKLFRVMKKCARIMKNKPLWQYIVFNYNENDIETNEQIKKKNLGHAYLFSGPRGVGKTSLARIIATTIGCDPVFDITEIDAASHNKVDDIRELNDSVNFFASSPGKKRVFIFDEVHMLSNAASNAFLKTLEEPPEHVIFILATTEPERVIETIRSRTTHLAFKRLGNE